MTLGGSITPNGKSLLEEYVGKWVRVEIPGVQPQTGKVLDVDVRNDSARLLPYLRKESCSSELPIKLSIVRKGTPLGIMYGSSHYLIIPTTQAEIQRAVVGYGQDYKLALGKRDAALAEKLEPRV